MIKTVAIIMMIFTFNVIAAETYEVSESFEKVKQAIEQMPTDLEEKETLSRIGMELAGKKIVFQDIAKDCEELGKITIEPSTSFSDLENIKLCKKLL